MKFNLQSKHTVIYSKDHKFLHKYIDEQMDGQNNFSRCTKEMWTWLKMIHSPLTTHIRLKIIVADSMNFWALPI